MKSLTSFVNEFAAIAGPYRDDYNSNQPGQIVAANDSRFIEANFSEPLTAYATGWRDEEDIQATLDFIAPVVPVSRRFEHAVMPNAESFLSETDDVRAIGSSFKRVEYTSSKENGRTLNKGLTIRVDMDNVAGIPNWRQVYTGKIMQRLARNELRRGFTLLVAAAVNTPKTWDTTAGKDPDQDAMQACIDYKDLVGMGPQKVVYDVTSWQKRRTSFRAQNNAGGYANAGMTEAEVAAYLGVRAVRKSEERYIPVGTATTKSRVLSGGLVLFYRAEENMTPEDASNIKRFVSMTDGGTRYRVYEQQVNAKMIDITVEHYSNIIVTAILGVQSLTVS